MQNADRNRQNALEQSRHWHSGPTEEGQTPPRGDASADTQSIDLNHATWQQLLDVEGFDEPSARALVDYRVHHGHFRTWDDLAAIDGMTPERVRGLQHAARIGGIETS